MQRSTQATQLINQASQSTVSSLFAARARQQPDAIAIEDTVQYEQSINHRALTYRELDDRVNALVGVLREQGVTHGKCIAIISANRLEYHELFLAAARIGAVVACQNWRLTAGELVHCLELAEPVVCFASSEYLALLDSAGSSVPRIVFGEPYEALLAASSTAPQPESASSEDALLLLYTSGTTGLPKGAVLSHRAEIARNMVVCAEFGLTSTDNFVAWSPLYHMGAAELSLGTLMSGGKVIVVDGFDVSRLVEIVATETLGWLLIMPGMAEKFADALDQNKVTARGIKLCGVMADLVPPHVIARITRLLGAPFANTFGATETGCPPCSSNRIPVGVVPDRLSKQQSPFCEVRLVDGNDIDVADGTPGELAMRGPTLFSGYWRNEKANLEDFRGGWFHMGDVFVRNADGTLDFVDRVKYMIKTGGENVYPAEIERAILSVSGVADAAVVRQHDPRWGEVPIAFVACVDKNITKEALLKECDSHLARYKQPKDIKFIELDDFPRSASGKIQRHELEKLL